MPQFAANLSLLYPEHAFLDRFEAAARDGFKAVECLFPYAFDKEEIAARLKAHGLQQVLINAPPGNWDAGERGLASLPGREEDFRKSFATALEYAQALNCPRIHVMAGLLPADGNTAAHYPTYISNLRWAAQQAAKVDRVVLIEPINTRDMPGYFLNRQDVAHRAVADVGEAGILVQMDLYHCQIVEGDLATKIRHYLPTGQVGHIQIAGVPQRHEPDTGEVHFSELFALLDDLGYQGWVGCEYRPANPLAGGTTAGMRWMSAHRTSRIAQLEAELAVQRHEMQDFAFTVSHDLRASLRHIISYAHLVQEDAGALLSPEVQGFLGTITDSAKHMGVQMDGLTELSRLGTVTIEATAVPLQDVVQEVRMALEAQYPARQVQWRVDAALPAVQGDATLVALALRHVLDNAIKFTAHAAEAVVEVSAQTSEGPGVVRLCIRDNGAGYNPALQDKLFHPFQRLHTVKQFPGIGMGLALTRKIMQRLGGSVGARGHVDHGCTVELVFKSA